MLFDPRRLIDEEMRGAALPEEVPPVDAAPQPAMAPPLRDYLTEKYLNRQRELDAQQAKAMESARGPELALNLTGALSSFGAGLADSFGKGGGGGKAAADAHTERLRKQLYDRLLNPIQAQRASADKEFGTNRQVMADERAQKNLDRQIAASEAKAAIDERRAATQERRAESWDEHLGIRDTLAGRGLDLKDELGHGRLELDRQKAAQQHERDMARVAQAIEKTNLSREQKAEAKDRLSDSQLKVVIQHSEAIEDIEDLAKKAELYAERYPWAESLNALARAVKVDDPGFSAAVMDSKLISKTVGKAYEGGRMTDYDQRFYDSALPNLDEKPATFKAKLGSIKERIGNHRSVVLEGYYRQGKNINNFKDQLGDRKLPERAGGTISDQPATGNPALEAKKKRLEEINRLLEGNK